MSSQGRPQVPRIDHTPATTVEDQVMGNMNDFEFGDSLFYKFKGTALKLLRPINPFAVYSTSNEQHVGRLAMTRFCTKKRNSLLQT